MGIFIKLFRTLRRKKILFATAILLSLTAMFFLFKAVLIIPFIALGAASLMHTRFTKNYIGLELCIFFTCISSLCFGPVAGAIVGCTSLLAGLMLSEGVDGGIIVSLIAISLIAFISPFFGVERIVLGGVLLTLLYDIVLSFFYFASGSSPFTMFSFTATHLLTNLLIFSTLSSFFISLCY